jgi:hypothetical protein
MTSYTEEHIGLKKSCCSLSGEIRIAGRKGFHMPHLAAIQVSRVRFRDIANHARKAVPPFSWTTAKIWGSFGI